LTFVAVSPIRARLLPQTSITGGVPLLWNIHGAASG
jgi:hypothetical protein